MPKKLLLLWCLLALWATTAPKTQAQELKCNVQIEHQRVQGIDPSIFDDMKRAFEQFLNTTPFTDEVYAPDERIQCNLIIQIENMPSLNNFEASAQIMSARPVYNTDYNSVVLNYLDKDFDFTYVSNQPLDFNVNQYFSNLTSLLGFYAYTIIGYDKDTFGKLGGRPQYLLAQIIQNNAQQGGKPGWESFEGTQNRYWLLENLLNQQFSPFREGIYRYYRHGLDKMIEDPENARKEAMTLLNAIETVQQAKPISILLANFFVSKNEELINIFKKAQPRERMEAYNKLVKVNPTKQEAYDVLKQP